MSYPTPAQIEELFQIQVSDPPKFLESIDPNIKLTTTGHKHEFAGELNGKDEILAKHVGPMMAMLDKENAPPQREVVRVVGGGDSAWAAVDLKTTSTTKKGKPWIHDTAYFIHFTSEGKIDEMRAFYDTAHLNKHHAEAKA